jgi:hypothetical protein
MADPIDKEARIEAPLDEEKVVDEERLDSIGVNDAGVIPPGTIDPVYEAKARVLNHAVRLKRLTT